MSGISSVSSFPEPAGGPVSAVVVAGGSGRRMGDAAGGVRKQYLELDGEPVLLWAVRALVQHPAVEEVVVVLPPEDAADPPAWLRSLPVRVVAGGAERSDSVAHGLNALTARDGVVLVHDGARPFVSAALVDRVVEASRRGGAVAAVRAVDTIKEVDEHGFVIGTADRERLWHAQTPQGGPIAMLRMAHREARRQGWRVTDDATLLERLGLPVRVVEGEYDNLKITRPADLVVAEALARRLRGRAPTGRSP